jgi:hypothetical protein
MNLILSSEIIGIGASNIEERILAVNHQLEDALIHFEPSQNVPQAGVLVPFALFVPNRAV